MAPSEYPEDVARSEEFQAGYAPDIKPPTAGQTLFQCASCGSRYTMPVRLDPKVTKIHNCRNTGCPGPVVRL